MTTFDRLKLKILKDTGIELTSFKRTYAGIHQRASGAFVWTATMQGRLCCGSTISASELLTQERIEMVEASSPGAYPQFI